MADDITDTVSTVPKMPEIPPQKSDRCFDIYPTLCPCTNIEMWNVSETTTP